ncbi:phenylacetate-CoA ligase [Paenibacillus sp. UNCCL117]|uniref:phenylacetate--CoA ligase family protein n=1 Tax=unclassified Paenibacillus TaxID=185978 RepID=UPI0008826E62|nr:MULTISPECIES: phenylacetate--CoA ligase family protein [unclassified Paenibacillus]SDE61703.1 phenylacetate-CoA ligase [Paenibacillus sp. cl123]SFW69803.1 phenylacetate-CoA ligase [Paenibacillus sp. UNCCL117]
MPSSYLKREKFLELLLYLETFNHYYRHIVAKERPVSQLTLEDFPLLTKQTIKDHFDCYISSTSDSIVEELTTGSTGQPLKCLKTNEERLRMSMAIWRERKRHDKHVNINNFFGTFGAEYVKRYGDFFNFEPENMKICFEKLMKAEPRWLAAPITALKKYAKRIENRELEYEQGQIKFIELVGEFVEESDRVYIEKVFGCRTILHYGLRETWLVAYECKARKLHVLDDLFYIEQLHDSAHNQSELLVTSYVNKLMPIIRYKTGDLGVVEAETCSCGRSGQIVKLAGGRTAGIIKGPVEMLGDMFFKRTVYKWQQAGFDCIEALRVEQRAIDLFQINFIPKANYSEPAGLALKDFIAQGLGREVEVNLTIVESLPSSANGKSMFYSCLC